MSEEIKETLSELENFRDNFADGVFIDFLNKTEDCITNLQQENERLKEIQCSFLGTGCKRQLEDYKSRNEKAIEYLQNTTIVEDSYYHQRNCLLNILQGSDKECNGKNYTNT